ncbi:unnamed protein product [Boreogadus saida]
MGKKHKGRQGPEKGPVPGIGEREGPGRNPFRHIKMAWAQTKAVITTNAPPNNPEHQDLVVEAEKEEEATQKAEGKGLRPRLKNDTLKLVFEYQ